MEPYYWGGRLVFGRSFSAVGGGIQEGMSSGRGKTLLIVIQYCFPSTNML